MVRTYEAIKYEKLESNNFSPRSAPSYFMDIFREHDRIPSSESLSDFVPGDCYVSFSISQVANNVVCKMCCTNTLASKRVWS